MVFSALGRAEAPEPFSTRDLVGHEAYVQVGIPAGRYGSVLVKAEGQTHEFSATAATDIPAGTVARVKRRRAAPDSSWNRRRRPRRRRRTGGRDRCLTACSISSAAGVFAIFAIIIVVVLIVSYIGSRYKVAGANEALIVSGQRDKSPDGRRNLKVVRGGGVIVLPLVHKVGKLKLTARQINVNLADAVTRQGIKVAVQGVATFKIGADDESIRNAAERFLESQEEAVDSIVKNVLEGSLRSIVGTLTVEELNLDRMKFQQAVQDAAKGDLATSGLQIDSFTIQAIRDESGYMELIGQQETARRERDARMAKASADQEAAVREAEAEQVKINASRDVALRRAETETQTAAAEARAAQAGPLAEAEATQEVTRKQTELAQLEAARKETGARRRRPSARPRPTRRRRSVAPRARRAPPSPRPRAMPNGSSSPARRRPAWSR